MAYCTIEDIQDNLDERDLIRFTDDDDVDEPDQDKVTRAVAGASNLIDAHISARYGAGLDPVPGLVRDLAVDIAVYKITTRKGNAPEEWRNRYEDALALLRSIKAGTADIPGISVDEDTGTTNTSAAVVSAPANFSGAGEGMKGF